MLEEGDEDDEGQEQIEGDTPIHPDLIAAAEEMGLDLNSEQMRELQQFIVQQNIVDQSEEGDYDAEDAPEQKLEIHQNEDKQGEYGPEVDEGDHDDEQKDDDDMMIDLNELDPNEK